MSDKSKDFMLEFREAYMKFYWRLKNVTDK